MSGDPATRNRLNNNVDDRRLLAETGFYYVGGLNEDKNGNGALDPGEDLNNNNALDVELINELEYSAQSNCPVPGLPSGRPGPMWATNAPPACLRRALPAIPAPACVPDAGTVHSGLCARRPGVVLCGRRPRQRRFPVLSVSRSGHR